MHSVAELFVHGEPNPGPILSQWILVTLTQGLTLCCTHSAPDLLRLVEYRTDEDLVAG